MRRTVAFVALWFAAGAAAALVASAGVAVVSRQITGNTAHPAPLSADEVRAEVAAGSTTATTTTATSDPSDPTTMTTTSTTTTPEPTSNVPTTATTSPPAVTAIRSYDLVGGDVTLRFSASGVEVVVAAPAAGFAVDIGESHSGGARVEFESDDHRSRVDGWWDSGPQDEVREEADD